MARLIQIESRHARTRQKLRDCLHSAKAGHERTVTKLLASGANDGLRNTRCETAHDIALAAGHAEIAARL